MQGNKISFQFCDTMGLEGDAGMDAGDLGMVIDGHIKERASVISYNILSINLVL